MDWLWFGNMCGTANDNVTIFVILFYLLTHMFFNACQFHGREKLTIGQFGKAVFIAGDACKLFYVTIPRCNVFIANRPIRGEAITCRPFKIEVTPALCLSCP